MNRFLLFCIVLVSMIHNSYASTEAGKLTVKYNLCVLDASGAQIEKFGQLGYDKLTLVPPFVCPGDLIVNGANMGTFNNGSYSDVFFRLVLAANQGVSLTLTGTDAEMEVISVCTPTPPYGTGVTNLEFCGPQNLIIRVHNTMSNSAGTFTLTASIYTLGVSNITRTETSGTTNNDGNLCEGDDVTLQAFLTDPNVPGPDYSWDGPNGYTNTGNPITIDPVDPNHTGTYTVTVTDDNGCTFSSSTTLTINELPVFTIEDTETSGVANDDETVCVGDPFTLTANFTVGAGNTYAWNLPDGSSSTTHPLSISAATIAAHNGTFNLTVTDASGCTSTSSIMMTIEALPAVSNTELRACAISEGSTSGDFVLEDAEEVPNYPTNQNFTAEIDNGNAMTVTYHLSLAGAQTGTANASSGVFTDGTIIYARVEDPTTLCFDVAQITLTVVDLPDAVNTELRACEDPNNLGFADFTLTDAELTPAYPAGNSNFTADIDNGGSGITVTYHGSQSDADNNVGEIFDGPYANGTIVYARIEDNTTTCYNVAEVLLTVVLPPTANDTELKECEDPAGSGMAMFTLTDAELAPGFPTTNSNATADVDNGATRTVTYHASQADAEDNVGAIGNGSFSDGTIVYARVEDAATGCAGIAEVLLTVLEAPDPEIQFMGSPSDFTICADEAFSLDVVTTTGTAPYTYMWTLPNASTATGNPYTGTANQAMHNGNWVVTVTDANGCTGTDNIQMTVDPAPTNNSCGTASDLGSGTSPISVSGDNTCGGTGGGCSSPDNESVVYYTYTVPADGITELFVQVGAPHMVSVDLACGGGGCASEETIDCPVKGATYYIAVSSSEANEGPFNLLVRPIIQTPDITGVVYIDLDASGTFGGTDVGFQGAPVQLLQGCPGGAVVATTTTDGSGNYTFTGLAPGSYTVQVDQAGAGAPQGSSVPKNCCLIVDPCMPDAVLECEMGYPPPDCASNPYSVDNFCDDAYNNPLCNLTVIGDFACGQNPPDQGPWSGQAHCNGVYHNTSFYGFVAGTGDYSIQFTIFACAGSGVQYGLMDVCSPGGPYVICNGNANTGTVTVPASQLEPCKTYVFWIDGYSSSVCSYYIQVVGDFHVCEIPPIEDITIDQGCTPFCPILGTLPVTVVGAPGPPNLENINGVTLHWDINFNGAPYISTMTQANTDGLTIDIPFIQAGEYKICVRTEHPCPGISPPFCKTFVFEDLAPVYKEYKICTADFPWEGEVDPLTGEPVLDVYGNQWAWFGGAIDLAQIRTTPPTFNFSSEYFNECGCRYTQNLRILEVGTSTGTDSIAICQNQVPFMYHDTTFATSFDNLLYKLKGVTTKNGCDSLVSITTRILDMGGTINDECILGGLKMQFNMGLQYIAADRDSIKFAWKNAAGTVLIDNDSDSTNIVVPSPGTYTLEITVYKFGSSCTFSFNHTIDLTGRFPSAPLADNWPLKICENDNIATYNVLTPDPNLIYLWTVPATATKVQDDSTGTLVVRWNGPTGGNICVKARNLCGDGPETCLPVVYVDMIDPAFSLATEVCKDGTTPITATSTHTATPVVYNWDFAGGVSSNTNGTGPGPHNVSWNSIGTKTVSLSVSENGCLGNPVTKDIEVKELPPPPVVICAGTTSSSVTFEWTAVPGATSYNIIRVSGSNNAGSFIGQTKYEVTGLNLSDCVEIQVEAVLPGPCGNITSVSHECCAQDCGTLPTITISPIGPICLPGTNVNLDQTLVTVTPPVANSTGAFTVNGTPATIFNPTTLGAGTHTVQYTLNWDNNRCSQSATTQVIVRSTPTSDFTVGPGGCVLDPVTVTYTGGTTGAVYTWDFGADKIGNYNGPGPHQVLWTNAGTKTITLTVTKDGCTSTVTTKTVTVNPVLAAPVVTCADQRIDGVTFGWTSVANASGYNIKVDIVGGANVFTGTVTGTTYDVPNLSEGTQVVITVTAISNNGCPNTTGTITCKATACPNAKIIFPNKVITQCLTPNLPLIQLRDSITNNLPNVVPTVMWSSSNPLTNSAINNAVDPATFNPQIAKEGNHTLVFTYQQKDCIWKDSILVVLKPTPVASFTSDDKICVSDPLLVTYTGTSTTGRVLTWDTDDAVKTDITATTFNFKWATAGTYTVGLEVTLNGCKSDPFTKNITVEDLNAGPVISCQESLDKIVFNWTSVPCASEYEVFINGVSKGKQTGLTYTASGLAEGEMVELQIKSTSTCECPIPTVMQTCTAKACPSVVLKLTPAQTSICLTPNVTKIKVDVSVTGNTPDGKGTWSGTGIDQNGNFDPVVAGVGVHELTYSYTDSNCSYSEKTTITVTALPQIIWEAVQPECYDDVSGSFIFQIAGGTPPYTTRMDGNSVVASPVNGVTSGSHTFVVTDVNGCSATQTFEIKIPAQPSFEIKGPGIVNINKSATHTLDLTGMAAYINVIDSVVWMQNGKRICSGTIVTCGSVTNIPKLGPNEYTVTIYYNNGCFVTDVFPYVVTDLYITTFPEIINPGSSSGNNTFHITTSDPSLFVKKMRIYDRWGNLVFIAENFSASDPVGWNGRFGSDGKGGGTHVVPGVYVYIFEMESDSESNIVETGDVTVIR